jgi:hypothetical protein
MTTEIWEETPQFASRGAVKETGRPNNFGELTLHSLPLVDAKEQKSHE